ncbi:hypothetical protein J2Z83_003765 [Virgibacillus natechei]|uniref:Uncharacterized protein n=1 Tax=Virgibacillus natechei TaxID=1216297 RepID=A0ABS4IKX0_9BACI|nr:hypothetical protein [Virgibacillus natechei]MBP1971614.1 hypothetical protein [Virgibacillus natechei]UZD13058.1 hypothetical protein OLD84_00315 [Virgibacillus natechei]
MKLYDFYITPDEYEIAKKNDIPRRLVDERVRTLCWDKETAITKSVKAHKNNFEKWSAVAKQNDIPYPTFTTRVRNGMTQEEAATKPVQCKKQWSAEMRKRIKRRPDWINTNLKKYKVSVETYYRRRRLGWSKEKASTTRPMTKSEIGKMVIGK